MGQNPSDFSEDNNSNGFEISTDSLKKKEISEKDFVRIQVIGKGTYGKVVLVVERSTRILYAMKIVHKSQIIKKKMIDSIKTEQYLLTGLNHSFIINLRYSFQTKYKLFFVMEYAPGGDLKHHLKKKKKFSEKLALFYSAELLLCLKYLFSKNIVHRDLKPNNIVLSKEGHIRVTDFGLSTFFTKQLTDICAEMIQNLNKKENEMVSYDYSVDLWSFGILLYEMVYGETPFQGESFKEIFKNIAHQKLVFSKRVKASEEVKDLIRKLLKKEKKKRLGYGGVEEILSHQFFKGIDFNALEKQEVTPPFIPKIKDSLDLKFFPKKELENVELFSPTADIMTATTEKLFNIHNKDFGEFVFDSKIAKKEIIKETVREIFKKEMNKNKLKDCDI